MEYLEKDDIVLINNITVEKHGGNFIPPFNFLNEEPLDYLIEIIHDKVFGEPMYPEIQDKAGLYMFNIISNHVFQDGNKRTGLATALNFLNLNGYDLKDNLISIELDDGRTIPETGNSTNEILINFTLEVASGLVDLESCQRWFKENIEEI